METIMRFNNVKRFTRRYVDVRDAINASKLLVLNDESRCITRVDFIGNDYLTMINNLESECKGRSIVAVSFYHLIACTSKMHIFSLDLI